MKTNRSTTLNIMKIFTYIYTCVNEDPQPDTGHLGEYPAGYRMPDQIYVRIPAVWPYIPSRSDEHQT